MYYTKFTVRQGERSNVFQLADHLRGSIEALRVEGLTKNRATTDDFDVQITLRKDGSVEVMERHPDDGKD